MNDRELLERAARAIGREFEPGFTETFWNPLQCDKDAFRLMCSLNMNVFTDDSWVTDNMINVSTRRGGMVGIDFDDDEDDFNGMVRRAITRAAAAIGDKL